MIIQKIGVIGRTYRHIQRYRQILAILFKYGFGDVVDSLKIEQYLEIGLQMISKKRREKIETLSRTDWSSKQPTGSYTIWIKQNETVFLSFQHSCFWCGR